MTLPPDDHDRAVMRASAEAEDIFKQDAIRRAVRHDVAQGAHSDRFKAAAVLVMTGHADALRRLGE